MGDRLSRRAFLGTAGAAALVAAPGTRLAGAEESAGEHVRAAVAVLGGSLADLVAAYELRHRGVEVAVVARDVSGVDMDPCRAEDHDRLTRLARSLGLRVDRVAERGASLEGGPRGAEVISVGAFTADGRAGAEIASAFRKLDRMASEFDVAEPWGAVNASVRDALTLGGWIDQAIAGDQARHRLHQGFGLVFGAPASEVSLLFALATVASAGGARALFDAAYYPDAWVRGLRDALGRSLGPALHEGAVSSLDAEDGGVELRVGGSTISARRAVVSDPTVSGGSGRSRFTPGNVVTVVCTYASAPWGSHGWSGRVLGDGAPVHAVWPAGDGTMLVAALAGPRALGEVDECRVAALDALGRWLGPEAADPARCQVVVDSDTARVAAPPGALSAAGPGLRAADGRVHSTGSESALAWIGHPEGQVEIGRRVADEIVAGSRAQGLGG